MGLRAQLLASLLLVTVAAIVSIGAITIWQTRLALAAERLERVKSLTGTSQLLAERSLTNVRTVVEAGKQQGRLLNLSLELARAVGADEVVFYDEGGTKLAPKNAPKLSTDRRGAMGAVAGVAPHVEEREADTGGIRLIAYAPVVTAGRITGAIRVTFTLDAAVDATLKRARTAVMVLGAIDGLVLLFAAAWILNGAVLSPVRALARAAQKVAQGDLAARIIVRGPGELGRLADAFDSMTESLRTGRESLIRSEKLASVGRLAAGIAHEVGNPLAAILGYVDTLRSDSEEKPIAAELRADMLSRVRAETQRIDGIVKELLAYARPSHEDDEGLEEVDIGGVIEAAVSLAKGRSRDMKVKVSVPDDLPRAQGVASRLTQVLLNLVFNGADAMDGKGQLNIGARRDGDNVVVAVVDEGPGVDASVRDRIFDPFFTTKDPGRGTGLGLAVSQSIVEGYGGTLRLVPSETGARFEMKLPVA